MKLNFKTWLRISFAFGFTNAKRWQYIDIDAPYESMQLMLNDPVYRDSVYVRSLCNITDAQLGAVEEVCRRNNISIITPDDWYYPNSLRSISNPPSVLFALGDPAALAEKRMPAVAIIGARDCCPYSERIASHFSAQLSLHGVNIVSGFARGIDSSAHLAALGAEGTTTAVLGCGILYDYPRGTMAIKRDIAKNGLVLSEYPPTAKPAPENFKIRNRLITGLSDCVLVVEASERSGSLNSASHAAEQGKELFVVPPSDLLNPAFYGQSGLLADGATLALSPENIIDCLKDKYV